MLKLFMTLCLPIFKLFDVLMKKAIKKNRLTTTNTYAFHYNHRTGDFMNTCKFNCAMSYTSLPKTQGHVNIALIPNYFDYKTARKWEILCTQAGLKFHYAGTFKTVLSNLKAKKPIEGLPVKLANRDVLIHQLKYLRTVFLDGHKSITQKEVDSFFVCINPTENHTSGYQTLAVHTAIRYLSKPGFGEVIPTAIKMYEYTENATPLQCIYAAHMIVSANKRPSPDNKMLMMPQHLVAGSPEQYKLAIDRFGVVSGATYSNFIRSPKDRTDDVYNRYNKWAAKKESITLLKNKVKTLYKSKSYEKILTVLRQNEETLN